MLAAKFRSKTELHSFLSVECLAYLPPPQTINIYYLKGVLNGKIKCKSNFTSNILCKLVVTCSEVQYLFVPQYASLTIEKLLEEFKGAKDLNLFWPQGEGEILRLPRQFCLNIMNTVCGEAFRRFVKNQVEERNNKLADVKDLTIDMDPQIKAAFMASSHISCK